MPPPMSMEFFTQRFHGDEPLRAGDVRAPFERDRARVIHSAAFRRLQAKTQVMGIGEGDFHRTRLTHSLECAQIGTGLIDAIQRKGSVPEALEGWLPPRELMETACYAHDLGHPPFGHGGETALHRAMRRHGGFEGNGQTLRILVRLEKHAQRGSGTNPTRRLVLAVLKYPVPYSAFAPTEDHPPKCYLDDEADVVDWALKGFSAEERAHLRTLSPKGKALHRTLDCSAMELADDIAYGVHDIEDIVARHMATRDEVQALLVRGFDTIGGSLDVAAGRLTADRVCDGLFGDSYTRKQIISRLVGTFITAAEVHEADGFAHPLLRFRVGLPPDHRQLLDELQDMSFDLAINRASVRQLERRGQRVVTDLFRTFLENPAILIPDGSWDDGDVGGSIERRVCDYVAGMTDSYAEKVYKRLFIPGFGSSNDLL